MFAANGFEGASTRAIAEAAGVNLPAIQYYFGSKEGLYRAVLQQFAEQLQTAVAPLADRINEALAAGQPSRRALVDLLCAMLDVLVGLILDESGGNRESRQKFFARTEVEPSPAVEDFQAEMVGLFCTPCCAIVGRLIGRPPDDEQVLLRMLTIIGQAKMFCGWGTQHLLRWDTIDAARVKAAQAIIREHVEAIFLPRGK